MASANTSVRYPWVAFALSFLSSGVGHIYCGRIVKGLLFYASRFLLPLLIVLAAFSQPSNGILIGLILLPAAASVAIYLFAPFDAFAIAKRAGVEYKLKDYNRPILYWVLIIIQLTYPVGLTWLCHKYVYEPFLIPTRSMTPSFLAGDRVLVNKRPLRNAFPERGDVIAFRTPASELGRIWLKRVVAVAGDHVVMKGRTIEVNGKTLEHERVALESMAEFRRHLEGDVYYETNSGRRYRVQFSDAIDSSDDEFSITVPERCVFVLGDNRDRSRDGRHIGPIHVEDVIGYVDYNYFPTETWSRFGLFRN